MSVGHTCTLALLGLATVASSLACTALLGVTDVPTPSDAATSGGDSGTNSGAVEGGGAADSTSQDGTSPDAVSASDGGVADGGSGSDSSSDGPPESGSDGSIDGSAGDAGQDACAASSDAGAVGTLGCPCSTTGEAACNGNAQKLALLCSGGVWVPDGTCASGQLCDSRPGSNQGTCQPIDPVCASASPGQDVCSTSTTAVQCGPDLVSHSPVATCTNRACVGGTCVGVCTPGTTQCASDTQVQTCGADGQWATATCTYACVGASCGGTCKPGATQTCSVWNVSCGCDVGGNQTCGANGQWGSCG